QGESAPHDVHPLFLTSPEGARPFNFSQILPYPSKDISQHEQLYLNIQDSLSDVFEWLEIV
ncbi:hypothetical protein M405DRAFT_714881, partial [Rhizopogon salebrosus TDB-379]